jgi:hypothetical protein
MALTLIKEDGTGKADANSYADVADGNAYFAGHLYPSAWNACADDRKAEALVMATRVVDAVFQFNGFRAHTTQALQWPRERCPDPDKGLPAASVLGWVADDYVEPDVVPALVVQATCEMARELIVADRTAAPPGQGIDVTTTGSGDTYSSTRYSKIDTRPIISPVAKAMLSKYGALASGTGGAVKLVRA